MGEVSVINLKRKRKETSVLAWTVNLDRVCNYLRGVSATFFFFFPHPVCASFQNFSFWFLGFHHFFFLYFVGQFTSSLSKISGRQGYGCRNCFGLCTSCVVSTCLWLMLRSERKIKWEVPLSFCSVNGMLKIMSKFQQTEAKIWYHIVSQMNWPVLNVLFGKQRCWLLREFIVRENEMCKYIRNLR